LEKKRILVVDDDKSLLKSLAEILESEGYSVDTAETGKEATEKAKSQYYNLAVLDIKLPDMDGTKLLEIVDGHLPRTVKIMITGYPSIENATTAVNLKADGYVIKPVDPDELLKIIREKLKLQEEADLVTEDKVAKWIKTRAEKL
jgi:DNA-binding NtrC family response regulator